MAEPADLLADADDIDAVTRAVLTASRVLVAVAARSLAAVEGTVTLAQFRMLVVLSTHGSVKLVALAQQLGVNPSTAMRMVDRLITAGLISRQVNPSDRRETVLRLTPAGLRIVDEVTARRRDEIAAVVERMAPQQREALVAALTAFTDAGGERDAETPTPPPYPLGWAEPAPPRRPGCGR
ncbi:MarR family winged helix-turn-helix transcriptional regulator [Streptomyces sp. 184]|uniref:MarR family winged helix-turn-helix transcriptional regulator n=1 Tax=Streptomyces sp. 184 TaxID=1827526 RepID=UPI003891D0E9